MGSITTDRRIGLNSGAAFKVPCKAASTANLVLSGEQTVDGVACVTGDRVLVKNQTDQTANGIWVVSTASWTRDLDFDGNLDAVTGTQVMTLNGNTNSNSFWRLATIGAINFGSSLISFARSFVNDSALISFIQSGTGAVARTVQDELYETVKVTQFGMSTAASAATNVAALLAACTAAGANGKVVIPAGTYQWTSAQISTYGITIQSDGATLQGPATGTFPYMLCMNNSFQSIQGQLNLDTKFNTGYTCAFNTLSNFGNFYNIIVKNTYLAYTIGASGTNPMGLSENKFVACVTSLCCRALEMYGIFTTASFIGCIFTGGDHVAWTGMDITSVRLYGAYAYFAAGELASGSVYSGTYAQCEVNQALYNGSYYSGSLIVTGCDIETIKPLLRITNLATTPIAANAPRVIFTNNRIDCYYSLLTAHSIAIPNVISSSNVYNGRLVVNSNRIYIDTPLGAVFPVSIGAQTKAQINFEDFVTYGLDVHYGTGVVTWAGIPPQFSLRSVFSAHRTAAFSPASGTIIPFDTVDTGPNGNPFIFNSLTGSYNTATGVFTAPTGGLSSVTIVWNWNVPTMNNASSACFILYNSPAQGIVNRRIANTTPVVPAGQLTAILPEMLAGDTLSCEIYTNVGALAMDVSTPSYNNLNIMAMVQTPNA